jgi:hypothetical protein
MKKTLYLITIVFLSACSRFQTKQQRAEHLVKTYLDSTLNDPSSYQNVKFSKIDTMYSTFEENPDYMIAKIKADSIDAAFSLWKTKNPDFDGIGDLSDSQTKYFIKMNDYYSNAKMEQLKICEEISKNYAPKFKGWHIINNYRAKNGFGALGLHQTEFEIDSTISKIIRSSEN